MPHSFSPSTLDIPNVEQTLGWAVIGIFLGLLFYGVMLCQAYHYYRTYKDDSPVLKRMVAALIVAETVHSILSVHWGYYYAVSHYGDPAALTAPTVSLGLLPATVTTIIAICQFFYARRVYLILPYRFRNIFITIVVILGACAIGFVIALTVQLFILSTFKDWLHYKWIVSGAYASVAALDLIISSILAITLYQSHTGIKRTDAVLKVLMVYGFSTGIITSILSTMCLLIDLLEEKDILIIAFSLTSANVYAFAMLVTLNMRQSLAQSLDNNVHTEWLGLSALERAETRTVQTRSSRTDNAKAAVDITMTLSAITFADLKAPESVYISTSTSDS